MVAPTIRERRQTLPNQRSRLCVQTKHVSGPCQGCAQSVGDLAHVVDTGEGDLKILCSRCCPCAAAGRNQTGPESAKG